MSHDKEKQLVAKESVKLIKPGMVIGIGTGSTAIHFIHALKERLKEQPFPLSCVTTSLLSKELIGNSLPLIDESLDIEVDITFDGADRVDLKTFYLIKGGGGALLREKIVAAKSKQNIVLVDSSKLSSPLAGFPVAVEIVRFGYKSTLKRLQQLGYEGQLRYKDQRLVLSDNDNYIYDCLFKEPILDPEYHHNRLKTTLGVIETGFFLNTATTVYIGYPDGHVEVKNKP